MRAIISNPLGPNFNAPPRFLKGRIEVHRFAKNIVDVVTRRCSCRLNDCHRIIPPTRRRP
jgi:hypothetical protein